MKRVIVVAAYTALLLALLSIPAADRYYQSSWGQGCARCHEIKINYEVWQKSAHRKINCLDCHASTLLGNLRRVKAHLTGQVPARIHMKNDDAVAMVERCRGCHQQEFAQWSSGPHSATFARLFTDREHNSKRPLMEDCLRCHGMLFEGSIKDVAQPLDMKGPWQLVNAKMKNQPAIPCLSCHAMHLDGEPLVKEPDLTEAGANPIACPAPKGGDRVGAKQEIMRPSVGLYDRRLQMNISASILPIPAMFDGPRAVKMSKDRRQSLCYQCHAPLASMQIGTADDRTPKGVHEGLSCLACHQKHAQNTRQSCADCHPRLSNCGLDVEKMDTTFLNPKSRHNVHWVKCADCHEKGIPKKKAVAERRGD